MITFTLVCLFVIFCTFSRTFTTELCNVPTNIGHRLQIGIFKTKSDTGLGQCANECWSRIDCQSFNFHKYSGLCELSSDTAMANSGQVVITEGFVQSDKELWSQKISGPCASVSCPTKHKCTVLKSGHTVCLVTDCGNPPTINYATVGAGNNVVGSVRAYSCDAGYSSSSNQMSATCMANGKWKSVPFTCTASACSGTLYDGRCYTMSTSAKPWADAKADCESKNEKLVDIETDAENTVVTNMVIVAGQNTWIGGSDAATEGTWVWTNGVPFSYTNWYATDPDGGTSQNCVGYWTSLGNLWIDVGCTSSLYYICESI